MAAKVLAEAVLFIANFAIQRDFVFTKHELDSPRPTDWDRYYLSVPATAKLTRRYSTSVLVDAIRRHARTAQGDGQLPIVEIGGSEAQTVASWMPSCRVFRAARTTSSTPTSMG